MLNIIIIKSASTYNYVPIFIYNSNNLKHSLASNNPIHFAVIDFVHIRFFLSVLPQSNKINLMIYFQQIKNDFFSCS